MPRRATSTSFKKGHIPWCKGKKYSTGNIPWNKGIPHTEEAKRNMSLASKGKKKSDEMRRKLSLTNKGRSNFWNRLRKGKNHWNWKGGITPIGQAIRNSMEYEQWRTKVFERDLYTCQDCGQIGGYLEADHIKPFSLFPKLRFDINNGRTLCKPCHKKTPTYGVNVIKMKVSI